MPPVTHTLLAGGDDCALLQPAPGQVLAVSSDMLVEGRHFLPGTDPARLGHKALAVNLSDLAAMGARPRWVLLALALPSAEDAWVAAFAAGFRALAEQHQVDWVGGDTTAGPRNLAVTVIGEVAHDRALRRAGAQPGDEIWVSGTLGGAACGLALLQQQPGWPEVDAGTRQHCIDRLECPQPRVALGLALAGLASAAIDVSDGLLADLQHVLDASGVGADLQVAGLPLLPGLVSHRVHPRVRDAALAGGDDYELCFTASPVAHDTILRAAHAAGVPVTRIGRITGEAGLRAWLPDGQRLLPARTGYDHFALPGQAQAPAMSGAGTPDRGQAVQGTQQ